MAKPREIFSEMLRSIDAPASLLEPYDDDYLEKVLVAGRASAIAFINGLRAHRISNAL